MRVYGDEHCQTLISTEGETMSLYSFQGSERNLNRKGHGQVQTGPTKAGRVQKPTKKRARKRAGGGPRYDSRPNKYGNVQKGHRGANFQLLIVICGICFNKKRLRRKKFLYYDVDSA